MKHTTLNEKKYNRLIWILSIVIPIAVVALFGIKIPGVERLGFLPPMYAGINALTALVLVTAVVQIKKGNRKVSCKVIDIDKYKRYVSICNNIQGDLAEIMLKNKQAKVLTRYLHLAPQKIQDRYNKYK